MCGIIIKYGMVISLLSCIAHQTMAQYAGKVFVDENKNGLFDKGEKLLQDVSVSDGLNVVSTDSDGTFRLPGHTRAHFLFIPTHSGYNTDNAYYRPIETGRMEYDFSVYPCRNGILAVSDRMGCGNHHERNRNAAFLMGKAVTVTVTKCLGINRLGINDKIY